MPFRLNPLTAQLDLVSVLDSESEVIGPNSSTDKAITRWSGTTGQVIQDSPGTLVQDSGALETQAIIVERSIEGLVSVPSGFTMISTGVEVEGGELEIESDGELLVI